ncbi:MAG TPA: transporter substrate-binding domain-containing protein [Rheinheimera sp.]|nr:transporter substrate-binding domain-containing protein [Rheinheimera sp.]
MLASLVLPVMLLCQSAAELPAPADGKKLSIELVTEVWSGFTEPDQSGAYFELVNLIYQPWQPKLKVKFTNFNRAVTLVKQGKADMTLAVSAHDREQLLLSELPIDKDQIMAIYNPIYHKVTRIDDLHSLRLAWNLAYDFGAIVGVNSQGYEVPSVAQGIELVMNQRIDVYLSEQSQYEYYLQQRSKNTLPLEAIAIGSDLIYAAFVNNDKGLQLKCIWDQRFQMLAETGELQQLYQRFNAFHLVLDGTSGLK